MKWADLVNRSTITQIESNLWAINDNPTMKSMLISSHFQSRILNGLQQPSRLHIVGFNLSADITFWHIVSCLTFHSYPPELLPQIMIHLGSTRMNRLPRGMNFIQNLLFLGFFLWHNQSILEPQCAFHILMETSNLWVTISHSSLDMAHAFISLLCSNDLVPQGGYEGDVEQQQVW
jgi:hypothetical protein